MKSKSEPLFSVTKKDLEISYFSGSGGGGQHRNKHKNCVRIRHVESGVMTTGQDTKHRDQNLKDAFRKLCNHPMFKNWIRWQANHIEKKKTIDQIVEEQMQDVKIEYYNSETGWTEDDRNRN